jgi:hypothetical protein
MADFRQRFLYVKNRLAELAAKYGPPAPDRENLPTTTPDPSWGPLGSLAQHIMEEEEFKQLLALHMDAIRLERQQDEPPPSRPARVRQPAPPRREPKGADW